jgi:pimeloyl-ACP methyl ester carboxylesterase
MSIEQPEPSPASFGEVHHDDEILQAQANAAIERWLHDHPGVNDGIKETVRAHTHLAELSRRSQAAAQARREADDRKDALLTRHDPAGHRVLGFTAGMIAVTTLVILDAIPLNWAAQAFGLDSGGTWLVTLILLAASIGAMLGFELTSRHPRRRALLAAVVTVAYVALLGLRSQFLTTVAGESFPVALLQSAMLTVISVGLVLCGSAILARTRSLSLSRSCAAAQRARQAAAQARSAQDIAAEKLHRHVASLRSMLLPWALGGAAPAGVNRARWVAALERAVSQLFPAS